MSRVSVIAVAKLAPCLTNAGRIGDARGRQFAFGS